MKKKLITSWLSLLAIASLLAGCQPDTSASVTSAENTQEVTDITTTAEKVDYVHNGSVKEKMDYNGKTFADDGVEQVTLHMAIDGDTTHFKAHDGSIIKIRYWGIDTPESTGKVQPWGRAASSYNKSIIKAASENGTIVITTPSETYTKPDFDSTGSRYVGIVWYNTTVKNAPLDQLYCLNLEMVQEGYSQYKNSGDALTYSEFFVKCEDQARALKLHVFSDELDPDFNYGDYKDVSLLDLKREIVANLEDPTHQNSFDGANVTIQGTVAGFAGNVLYLVDHFDKETGSDKEGGEYAGINIFVGMSGIPSRFYERGAYIEVAGNASDSENFGFQIAGATFPTSRSSKVQHASKVLFSAEENTEHPLPDLDFTAEELSKTGYDYLYSNVTVTDNLYCYNAYRNQDKGYMTLYFQKSKTDTTKVPFQAYINFMYKPYEKTDPTTIWSDANDFIGKTFRLNGVYGYHKTSSGKINMQILPSSSSDLAVVEENA